MTRAIKIEQCYFCPHILMGNSSAFNDVGWCKLGKRGLDETMIEGKPDVYTQTIPDWCELDEV